MFSKVASLFKSHNPSTLLREEVEEQKTPLQVAKKSEKTVRFLEQAKPEETPKCEKCKRIAGVFKNNAVLQFVEDPEAEERSTTSYVQLKDAAEKNPKREKNDDKCEKCKKGVKSLKNKKKRNSAYEEYSLLEDVCSCYCKEHQANEY